MRRGAALAAAALVTLLGTAYSCKPSSLTPFTDWREPETESAGRNGRWSGETVSTDNLIGRINFSIASRNVADLSVNHNPGPCGNTWYTVDVTDPIEGDTFDLNLEIEGQGRLAIQGQFSSDSECSGTYYFEGISATGTCPTSGSGSFVATKVN